MRIGCLRFGSNKLLRKQAALVHTSFTPRSHLIQICPFHLPGGKDRHELELETGDFTTMVVVLSFA